MSASSKKKKPRKINNKKKPPNNQMNDKNDIIILQQEQQQQEAAAAAAAINDPYHLVHRAVSLGFLLEFTNTYNCWNLTTNEVMHQIIIPQLEKKQELSSSNTTILRYTDLIISSQTQQNHQDEGQGEQCHSHSQVGTTTVFISHTWSNSWGLLVLMVRKFATDWKQYHQQHHHKNKQQQQFPIYFWIDLFAIPQQKRLHVIQQQDLGQLEVVIQIAKNVLLVCDEPNLKPLSRIWCLFEIVIALHSSSHYGKLQIRCGQIIFQGEEEDVLDEDDKNTTHQHQHQQLQQPQFLPTKNHPDILREISESLDMSQADATLDDDKERILNMIQQLFPRQGIQDVNRIVKRALRRGW